MICMHVSDQTLPSACLSSLPLHPKKARERPETRVGIIYFNEGVGIINPDGADSRLEETQLYDVDFLLQYGAEIQWRPRRSVGRNSCVALSTASFCKYRLPSLSD